MQFLTNLPLAGWLVIAFIAVLVFIVLMYRGIHLRFGDKELSAGAGKAVDKKINAVREEFKQKDADRLHDEELRKKLFRISGEIDEKTKADERRIVRKLYEAIKDIFKPYIKCEMPGLTAAEIIKDELNERVDYNNMREKFAGAERRGYLDDILLNIEADYKAFLFKIPRLPCGTENYPDWQDIRPEVERIIKKWADDTVKILIERINEKIDLYTAEEPNFILTEYKTICVDFPVRKNKKYIKNLQ